MSSPSLHVLENECSKEMNQLQIWFSANELQINPKISAIIVIPSKLTAPTTNLSTSYNERPINCFESSKYLGVNLDNKLFLIPLLHYRKQSGQICRYFKQASFHISFFCTSFVILFSFSPSSFIWSPIVGKRQPILPQ